MIFILTRRVHDINMMPSVLMMMMMTMIDRGVSTGQPWKGGRAKQLELFERSTSLNRMSH